MIAERQSDMLAYADDCLEPARRARFETMMAGEPDIRRQVEQWREQNDAIRAAFAQQREWPAPIRVEPPANANARTDWMPQQVRTLRRQSAARPMPRLVIAASPARIAAPAPRKRFGGPRRTLRIALAVAVITVASIGSASGTPAHFVASAAEILLAR